MSVTFSNNTSELNVSNANYRTISQALGIFDSNYFGSLSATALKEACQKWQAELTFDAGLEMSLDGNIIDCGRSRGYLNIRVQKLLEMAQEAIELGVEEVWFG